MEQSSTQLRSQYRVCPTIGRYLIFVCLLLLAQNILAQTIRDSVHVFGKPAADPGRVTLPQLSFVRYNHPEGHWINAGFAGDKFLYIAIKLSSDRRVSRYFWIDDPLLDTVIIYHVQNGKRATRLYLGGQLVAFKDGNDFIWHVAHVDIDQNPSYYLVAVKSANKKIGFKYHITTQSSLVKSYRSYERIVFFYFGMACLIAFVLLLALVVSQRIVFAVYFAYIVCISAWIMAHYGIIFPWAYPQCPVWNKVFKPVTSLGAGLFLLTTLKIIFASQLQPNSNLRRTIVGVQQLLLATMACMFFLLHPQLANNVRSFLYALWYIDVIIVMAMILYVSIKPLRTGPTSRIVAIAMIIISASAIVQMLANLGVIRGQFFVRHSMAAGSLFENFIMAFGLLYGLAAERKLRESRMRILENDQTETLRKLLKVQDQERRRIASDLHDTIGPLLAALKINFLRLMRLEGKQQQSELIRKTESIIDDCISEIRNLAHNLMPKSLQSNGLASTLSAYFDDLQQLYHKKIIFVNRITAPIPEVLQINAYRIVSEMVINAMRHSDAGEIMVILESEHAMLSVTVHDNGQGFEYRPNLLSHAQGIRNVETRVEYLKGRFRMDTGPGRGTKVRVELPL